jgi:HEAT repeat protein
MTLGWLDPLRGSFMKTLWQKLFGLLATLLLAGTASAADIDALVKQMKNKDAEVRRQAAMELFEAGAEAKPALDALIAGLKDKDLYVRRFSAQAIGAIGPDAKSAIVPLTAVMRDSKEAKEVMEAVVTALGKVANGKGGVDALVKVAKDASQENEVRRKAIEALGAMGADAKYAVPGLTELLTGKDPGKPTPGKMANPESLKIDLVTALGNIAAAEDEAAVKAIEEITASKTRNRTLKSAANEALKKIKARKAA